MERPAMTKIIFVLSVLVLLLAGGLIMLLINRSPTGEHAGQPLRAQDKTAQDTAKDGSYSFLLNYQGMKYPEASGLRRYIGEEPLRIYPGSESPYVYDNYKPEVVELINEVGVVPLAETEEPKAHIWCLILDSRGVSGYAQRSDLVPISENDETFHRDFGCGVETLGGFKVGDRIETLIGRLDRDYYLAYENGRIYEFLDSRDDGSIDPMDRPFANVHSLDAFVWYTNHVALLRTNSPEFPLQESYKVGDNAQKVLDHYASKYPYYRDDPTHYRYSEYTFVLEEGHRLEFHIDTETLNPNSVISAIWID